MSGINWAERNAFWIMLRIWRGNGTVDEGLRSTNIRSEFNLAPNDQGHYGRTPEDAEGHAAAVSASDQPAEGNNMLSWHQMKAGIAGVSGREPN